MTDLPQGTKSLTWTRCPSLICLVPEGSFKQPARVDSKNGTRSNMDLCSALHVANHITLPLDERSSLQVRELMRQAKSMLQHLLLASGAEQHVEEPAKVADDVEERDPTCVICMDEPGTMTFLPCGHAVVCSGCSKLVMASGGLCPMCREGILQVSS